MEGDHLPRVGVELDGIPEVCIDSVLRGEKPLELQPFPKSLLGLVQGTVRRKLGESRDELPISSTPPGCGIISRPIGLITRAKQLDIAVSKSWS